MYENLAILGAFVFLYSIVSGGLERTPINGAVVFAAFGLIMGPIWLDLLKVDVNAEEMRTLAELTLALVLFTDAANANLGILKRSSQIPVRLLLIGLPLTIVLGFGAGMLMFPELTWLEVAIIATMLAPTDAALGKAVVTNKSVPGNIREGLNVESGLNDGICVPILFIFLALIPPVTGTAEGNTEALALKLVGEQIGIGLAVGLGLTFLAGHIVKMAARHGWITESWRQLPVLALAFTCYAVTQLLGGSGFIACFTGGLLAGALAKRHKTEYLLAAEGTGDTLAIITWVCFGAVVIGKSIGLYSWSILLYSILSLTVIRMLPVFLVLTGLKLRIDQKLFMGWFGPRGLASIVFAVIVLNKHLPHAETITMTAVCTILLSVIGHGLSANPLVALLAARLKRAEPETA
ncbi:cation:proton antiporter [Pontiella sulfatireligans]|uniref:K(+)/H(+) antiporter NhaP2 n=1 Tax=Pontiella sulfatireligans TaxID=2750658 RepID=A0A6C2UW73_9BACT|nr:cation:proton antiporter [Pontiella sulfatireligans]VGO23434.1 K(+)/H(+) antiporter NhaP2 [Pontiella sulfatireligans]